ncbi:MAG: penicillin-binding protein 2 [Gammaproteobacteria bacterium]|nr:penicillin-binding protein 2 [Gammaproteobacteria bacterium]
MALSAYDLRNTSFEKRVFMSRVLLAFVAVTILIIGLVTRLVYLQVVGHQHYSTLSVKNRIKISPLPPTRGLIYDRNGKVLAENIPNYSLEIIPEQVPDMDATLANLQQLLNISDEEVERFQSLRKRQKSFASIPLKVALSDQEFARFAANRAFFQGVDIHARLLRYYPFGYLTAHVLGYMGQINEAELKKLDLSRYGGTHHIGKSGVEKSYETSLYGKAGYEEIEVNAQRRSLRVVGTVAPEPGQDLHLSIDIDLQKIAYDGLADHNGAVVAIQPETGEVLTLISKPGFDPNKFVYGLTSKEYRSLQQSRQRPLFNRTIRGLYPPGSTIKPFLGLAGLHYKAVRHQQTTYCPGFYQLPKLSHKYRCWKKTGHGSTNLTKAITESCDVYFYTLAQNLGIDRMHTFLSEFGFGQQSGLDIPGEKAGLLPSREWKRNYRELPWYPGETLITGIGQGFLQISPLQLARATAILANGGKVIKPHLVNSDAGQPEDIDPEQLDVQAQLFQAIVDDMVNVVHGARGTAKRISRELTYTMAGKTGTAQVFTVKQEEKYEEDKVAKELRDHALFIAFAPARAPKIAVAIVVENGGHGGSAAAPIARQVIDHYLQTDAAAKSEDTSVL